MAKAKKNNPGGTVFENAAVAITKFTGSTTAFVTALAIVLIWAISGPVFKYSEAWQLVINTGTTIVTFLMVFLIQRTQNKDSLAVQLKLNELIAATSGASNRLVDVEDLNENELKILKIHYIQLSELFEKDFNIKKSHSVEEAQVRHKNKLKTIIK